MKILVTGASGFIGSYLSRYCAQQGNETHLCDNNKNISSTEKDPESTLQQFFNLFCKGVAFQNRVPNQEKPQLLMIHGSEN